MRSRELAAGIATVLALWQIAAWAVQSSILPPPGEVLWALAVGMQEGLGMHVLISLWRILAGTFLAVAVGAPLGLLLGQNATLRRWVDPLIYG